MGISFIEPISLNRVFTIHMDLWRYDHISICAVTYCVGFKVIEEDSTTYNFSIGKFSRK